MTDESSQSEGRRPGTTTSSVQTSLENLSISSSTNDKTLSSNTITSPLIVCDCGYGWPKEKRPRQEKIRAVAKQISNFLRWQEEIISSPPVFNKSACRVVVVGSKSNLAPLEKRLSAIFVSNKAECHLMQRVVFQEGDLLSLQESGIIGTSEPANGSTKTTAASNFLARYTSSTNMVYLSPDAEEILDYKTKPPTVVIVGMLVDRRVALNRSKERASKFQQQQQQHSIEIAKLPLSQCQKIMRVTNSSNSLKDEEPLNIDTVLEIMQRWHLQCAGCDDDDGAALDNGAAFVKAAVDALMSHQERHPNRTLHL